MSNHMFSEAELSENQFCCCRLAINIHADVEMLSRIVLRLNNNVAIGLRNHKVFYQTSSCMCKDSVKNIESIEHPSSVTEDNDLVTVMKSASNSLELLNRISKNVRDFSAEQTLTALKWLIIFQKQKR